MHYEGTIIRPPSEAHSILFQVTTGCSHNKCIFCGAYMNTPFTIRRDAFETALDFAEQHCCHQNRVFLADGDALILPFDYLTEVLKKIRARLPWVKKVSVYANGKAIRSKTLDQLRSLQDLGLDRIYLGVESGHEPTLAFICKGETRNSFIEAAKKITSAGLFLSTTVLLGIAGTKHSSEHARCTAELINIIAPRQIGALTVMPIPGTKLYQMIEKREFTLPDQKSILAELKILIENITLERVQFHANHASNYLPLSGRLQKDKKKLLSLLDLALQGEMSLVPEHLRFL